jgi:hypothetical protein
MGSLGYSVFAVSLNNLVEKVTVDVMCTAIFDSYAKYWRGDSEKRVRHGANMYGCDVKNSHSPRVFCLRATIAHAECS